MTALPEYARLEASGLWRATPEEQRREVLVSIGDATLTISDFQGRALTHWSLAAVARANPGAPDAVYHPDGDPGETLELPEGETVMIAAIEKVRRAVDRRRPRRGRLRWITGLSLTVAVLALAIFWLPGALVDHTVRVVPQVKRVELGRTLMQRITRVAGRPCSDPAADRALARLGDRLTGPGTGAGLRVLPSGVQEAAHLPGGLILLGRALVEDHEEPDVVAGYILVEDLRRRARDPLRRMLEAAGPFATLRLLTTGALPDETLDAWAETLLTAPPVRVSPEAIVARFEAAGLATAPYAYARDVSGESVLELIEADPFAGRATPAPVLGDGDWVRLQGICGG